MSMSGGGLGSETKTRVQDDDREKEKEAMERKLTVTVINTIAGGSFGNTFTSHPKRVEFSQSLPLSRMESLKAQQSTSSTKGVKGKETKEVGPPMSSDGTKQSTPPVTKTDSKDKSLGKGNIYLTNPNRSFTFQLYLRLHLYCITVATQVKIFIVKYHN